MNLSPQPWRIADKYAESLGWVFDRQKGSHRVYKRDGAARPLTIPAHDQLAIGTLSAIIKQTGGDRDGFLAWLQDQ